MTGEHEAWEGRDDRKLGAWLWRLAGALRADRDARAEGTPPPPGGPSGSHSPPSRVSTDTGVKPTRSGEVLPFRRPGWFSGVDEDGPEAA